MAGNPLISQGVLNRLVASVSWKDNPNLNVTPPFLGKEGISLALQGSATTFIDTMTGAVTSPEPYMMVEVTIHLLKSQGLSNLYKRKLEESSLLGSCTVRPDSTALSPFDFTNCAIRSIRELRLNGTDAELVVSVGGYYNINSNLWG